MSEHAFDLLVNSAVTVVSTLFGYGVVAWRLRAKLDASIYQQGVKNIWDSIKHDREEFIELRTQVRMKASR